MSETLIYVATFIVTMGLCYLIRPKTDKQILKRATKALRALHTVAISNGNLATDIYTCLNHAENVHDTDLMRVIEHLESVNVSMREN